MLMKGLYVFPLFLLLSNLDSLKSETSPLMQVYLLQYAIVCLKCKNPVYLTLGFDARFMTSRIQNQMSCLDLDFS